MAERTALHAYISEEASEAWRTFAEENGVSVTGLLEAFGQDLIVEVRDAGGDVTRVRQGWVRAARKVDAVRRRRGR